MISCTDDIKKKKKIFYYFYNRSKIAGNRNLFKNDDLMELDNLNKKSIKK